MVRRTGLALAWLGLSSATMVLSLSACFVDVTQGKTGNCEDDGNPCTEDTCVGGTEQHTPAPGIECSLENNVGKCDDKGRCVLECEMDPSKCRCNIDTQCPAKDDCGEWKCNMASGNCERQPANENQAIPKQTAGDCVTVVCKSGEYFNQPEAMDAKPTTGDCVLYECSNGASLPKAADVGSSCSTGTCTAPNVCCSSGNVCVDCLSAADYAACGDNCPVKMCDGETTIGSAGCKSGFAADGVCCDSACTDVCKACNVMGSKGMCSDVAYYEQELDGCNLVMAGGVCDGKGQCLKVAGRPCQDDANCLSNKCNMTTLKCLGAPGEFCTLGTDCASGTCMAGACQ